MPVDALFAFQLEHRLGLLFGRQRRQKIVGRLCHRGARRLRMGGKKSGEMRESQHEYGDNVTSGRFHAPKTIETRGKGKQKSVQSRSAGRLFQSSRRSTFQRFFHTIAV